MLTMKVFVSVRVFGRGREIVQNANRVNLSVIKFSSLTFLLLTFLL